MRPALGAEGAWFEAETRLVRSPFRVRKRVEVRRATVIVTEDVTYEGGHPVDAVLGTSARQVVVDPDRDTPTTDLRPGATSSWPLATGRGGDLVDLHPVPAATTAVDRLLYLTGFPDRAADDRDRTAWVRLADPDAALAVTLRWDAALMPHAWYCLENNATPGFPWYAGVRVLAIEPATSWPAARDHGPSNTGGSIRLAAGERRTHHVCLDVGHMSPTGVMAEPPAAALHER